MKKVIIMATLAIISTTSFAQSKNDTIKAPKTDSSSLVLAPEMVVKLYNLLPIAAKAIPSSMDIKAAEASYALPVLQELYSLIVNKYQPKGSAKQKPANSK